MAENKTQPTKTSATDYLHDIEDLQRKKDCQTIAAMMEEVTGEPPVMWGASIVGFGQYHYKYASGREGDFLIVGFSSRKQNIALYMMCGYEHQEALMTKLGKYKTGKSCLYIKRLDDIDMNVLKELITDAVNYMRTTNHIAS